MKKRLFTKLLAFALAGSMILPLTACGGVGENMKAQDLMKGIEKDNTQPGTSGGEEVSETIQTAVTDFSIRLFQNCLDKEKNTLVSPLSVLLALSMTGNGAKGETLNQMETVFGARIPELNSYLSNYINTLPQGDKYKLMLANSVWFTNNERFSVNQDFLQTNANYYGADIYKAAFDSDTLKDINTWVEKKTDGMIKDILDEIPPEAVMYLINALVFEAEWAEIYEEGQVHDKTFTTEAGKEQSVELMYSDESVYLEDEKATGFVKYYAGQKYAFVALLPKEGVRVEEYVQNLTGEHWETLLNNRKEVPVNAAIPAFETGYDILMNDVLQGMGMTDAFHGGSADFTGLGTSTDGNIFINRVIHKTVITVGPKGTKAGAATVVEMECESAPIYEESKTVYLDRPFVYMLVDCESNQPFFLGTLMSVE